jgi:hypothetical protein
MDSLLETLKNPSWQFIVTAILTVVLGVATIIIPWLLARSKKELTYRLLTNTKIVSVREEYQQRVEIRFRSRRVKNVNLLIFKLINSGHKAITPDDYIEPVVLRFGGDSRILSASVVHTKPSDIKRSFAEVVANSGGNELSFPPALLNSGDWIKVNILVSDFQGPMTVSGRVIDVTEIKEGKDYSWHLRLAIASGVFICGMLFSSLIPSPLRYVYIGAVSISLAFIYVMIGKEFRRAVGE